MFTIEIDVHITRRLTMHHIYDEKMKRRATFTRWHQVLAWLIENDIRQAEVRGNRKRWVMQLDPLETKPSPHPATAPWEA